MIQSLPAGGPHSGRQLSRRGAPGRPATSDLPVDSLGFALDGAARVVDAVRGGASLPSALAAFDTQRAGVMTVQARGAVRDLSYRAMRALGQGDAIVAALTRKPPPLSLVSLLVCALALLAEPAESAAYAPFTIVDQAVRAAGSRRDPRVAVTKGLVNAVLRNFLRERQVLLERVRTNPVALWNYPLWWIDAMRAAWPDDWRRILEIGNTRAPMTLRVNRRKATVADYLRTLADAGIEASAIGAAAVRLTTPLAVDAIPGFAEGVVSVQDAGAQHAAPLLNLRDGMRVLDACAAPGGKTGHLLELADVQVVALDSDAMRARRIDDNLRRLGVAADVLVGDASQPAAWWDGRRFDRILVDVPCSASGIVRRHPDIRWLRRQSDVPALVARQRQIVGALWPLLAPGGEMLYVTCSIFPEESALQASWFERTQQDAVRLDAPGQILPATCAAGSGAASDHDGFFYARFLKKR